MFLVTMACANGLVALGLMLLLRAGLVSFGQALYFCLGAYAAGGIGRFFGVSDIFLQMLAGAQQQHQAKRHQAVGAGNGEEEHRPLRKEKSACQNGGEHDADQQRRPVRPQIFLGSARLNNPRGRNASTIAITK